MDRAISVSDIADFVRCRLCNGIIVGATTIIECLHTFCKSCIYKHVEENDSCPVCGDLIHYSEPNRYNLISNDRTFQDIINTIFPSLQKNEDDKEKQLYIDKKIPNPKEADRKLGAVLPKKAEIPHHILTDYHRKDEQLTVQLECKSDNLKPLKRRYLCCSVHSTVTLLKKFVAVQLFGDVSKCNELDIVCNDELLGKDHTLKFVQLTRWRFRDPPLVLHYRQKVALTAPK